jgi:hypothetical protein
MYFLNFSGSFFGRLAGIESPDLLDFFVPTSKTFVFVTNTVVNCSVFRF